MSFAGTYTIVIQAPTGREEGQLILQQDGESLSGTMESRGQTRQIENSKVVGGTASWSVDISEPMPLTLNFSATKEGDNLVGSVALGAFGSADFEATPA
jgi:hypothetical protein